MQKKKKDSAHLAWNIPNVCPLKHSFCSVFHWGFDEVTLAVSDWFLVKSSCLFAIGFSSPYEDLIALLT